MSGTKHDFKKPPINLIPFVWIEGVARVLAFGAAKYGEWNWAQGFAWSRLIGAAERHLGAWKDGEDLDPETGESHLLHLSCEAMFLYLHERFGLGEDDRKKWPRGEATLTQEEQDAIREAVRDPGFDPLEDATSADVLNATELARPASVHPHAETEAAALTSHAWGDGFPGYGMVGVTPLPPVDLAPDPRLEIPPPPRTPSETPHLDLEVERSKLIALRAACVAHARELEGRGLECGDLRRAIMESHA